MTDERQRPPTGADDDAERDAARERGMATPDATEQVDDGTRKKADPWLREGADAPDAADIENPTTQR